MRGYEAHESFWTNLRLYLAMIWRAVMLGLALQILFLGYSVYETDVREIYTLEGYKLPLSVAWKYYTGISVFGKNMRIEDALLPYAKGWTELSWQWYRVVADTATNQAYAEIGQDIQTACYLSFGGYSVSVIYLLVFWTYARRQQEEKFIRGAQLIPFTFFCRRLLRAAKPGERSLHVAEALIPQEMETKHMLILGSSGSGKSVLLNQIMVQIMARKDRCVIYDPKGEFVSKLYRPEAGDTIFSIFDQRSVGWNVFNEISSQPDYDIISRSLFAPPDSRDTYWYTCAADVFRTGLVYLRMQGKTKNSEMWDFFSQTLPDMLNAFRTLPIEEQGAIKHIDKVESPASASIISIVQERLQAFRYLRDMDGDFSFTQYVREGKGNIFLLNHEKTRTLMKPLLSLAVEIMSREVLSLPDDVDRRIFFILDEIGTLNRMDSLLTLETVGRSKGGCIICANQDLGRLEEVYGRANLKSFFNNFNTKFIFRVTEPETADFLSRSIGEKQVVRTSESRQMAPRDVGDRKSMSEQEKTERILMPSELQQLPDLEAVISVSGYGVSQLMIPRKFYEKRHPPFVPRDFGDYAPAQLEDSKEKKANVIANQLRI